jgi:hypothetical protein
LRSFVFIRRFINVSQREENKEFNIKIAKKHYNNHRFDYFFDQNIIQNSILLKLKMCKRNNENEQKYTQKIDEKIIYTFRISRKKSSRRKKN